MKIFVKAKKDHGIVEKGKMYEVKAEYNDETCISGRMIVIEIDDDNIKGMDSSFFE